MKVLLPSGFTAVIPWGGPPRTKSSTPRSFAPHYGEFGAYVDSGADKQGVSFTTALADGHSYTYTYLTYPIEAPWGGLIVQLYDACNGVDTIGGLSGGLAYNPLVRPNLVDKIRIS